MANKKTIQDVDAKLEELHRTLMRTVSLIDKYRRLRKRMVTGKVKVPPPPGIKRQFTLPAFDDDISDISERPVAPGTNGPC